MTEPANILWPFLGLNRQKKRRYSAETRFRAWPSSTLLRNLSMNIDVKLLHMSHGVTKKNNSGCIPFIGFAWSSRTWTCGVVGR